MEPDGKQPDQATDTAAEQQLADYLANNRQRLQPAPARPALRKLGFTETPKQAAEREYLAGQRALRQEQSRRQGEMAKLIQAAGRRYAECTLESFQAKTAAQKKVSGAVGDYIEMLRDAWESTGLVLYGPVGTGKDHLAISVAKVAIEQIGKRVAWVNGQSWFGTLRDNIDRDTPEAKVIGDLTAPDLLVLSDPLPPAMGKGDELTPYQASMLYRLIDARYSREQITIVTLNVNDDDEADRRIGEPTWDRINHGSWKIHCNWPTHRKPAREVR